MSSDPARASAAISGRAAASDSPPEAPFVWPPELVACRHRWAIEESMSAVRHAAMNELAALGGMLFRLRRALTSEAATVTPKEQADGQAETVQEMLEALNKRIGQAPDRLAFGRLSRRPPHKPWAPLGQTVLELVAAGRLSPAVRVVPCDPHLAVAIEAQDLSVAVACLLENALLATSPAPNTRAVSEVTVSFARKDDELALMVDDDGQPLSDARWDRMFEPFFSTRPGALGIGLNVARRIARSCGGDLVLEPRRPRGLHAELRLREAEASQGDGAEPAPGGD